MLSPKVSRKQIVPEDFLVPEDFRVFVDASIAEEQPEIDVSIELTVNRQSCEAHYCKSGKFRENFVFAKFRENFVFANDIKRHNICDV